jgi:Transglutaminase-like superfamily
MRWSTSSPRIASWPTEGDGLRARLDAWTRPDLTLAMRALPVAICAPLLMRLPADRLARALEPRRRRTRPVGQEAETIDRVLHVTDVVLRRGRPAVRGGCLVRGVTRYWCLRRAGIDVALCFGVGRIHDEIESHCWVTADGQPLREPEDLGRFDELFHICSPGVAVAAKACSPT